MTTRLRRTVVVLLLAALVGLTLDATPALAAPTSPAPAVTTADVQVVALPCWLNPVCEASKSVLDTVAEKFTDGAKEMLDDLAGAIDTATRVDLTEAFFTQNYAVMLAVSAPLVLMLFLFDLVGAVLRRRNPIRSLVGVFQAVFGAALAVSFTELALGATDALSSYVLHQGMAGSAQRLSDVISAGLLTGNSSGLLLVLSFFTMVAALFVWLILVLRKFAIYSVAVFAPIAFAGQAWAGTSRMAKRWAEALIALILSKFAIAVLFAVAASAIGTSKSVTTVIGGLVMLVMALFSPWLCLKLVHFVEVHVAGEMLANMKSGATAPANAAVAGMTRAQQAQSLLGGVRQKPLLDVPEAAPMNPAKPPVPTEGTSGGGAATTGSGAGTADQQATPAAAGSGPGTASDVTNAARPASSAVEGGTLAGGGTAATATGAAATGGATVAAKAAEGAARAVKGAQEGVVSAASGSEGGGPPSEAPGPVHGAGAAEVPSADQGGGSAGAAPAPTAPAPGGKAEPAVAPTKATAVGADTPAPEGQLLRPAAPPQLDVSTRAQPLPEAEPAPGGPARPAVPPAASRPLRPSSDQES